MARNPARTVLKADRAQTNDLDKGSEFIVGAFDDNGKKVDSEDVVRKEVERIFLIRDSITTEGGVGGRLIFGNNMLYTLEPSKTAPYHKGHPCICKGTYGVITSMSTRFKRILPILLDVPGRTGIRFHSGDSVKDTEGCIILFQKPWPIGRGTSRKSENLFVKWLTENGNKDIRLTILEP